MPETLTAIFSKHGQPSARFTCKAARVSGSEGYAEVMVQVSARENALFIISTDAHIRNLELAQAVKCWDSFELRDENWKLIESVRAGDAFTTN